MGNAIQNPSPAEWTPATRRQESGRRIAIADMWLMEPDHWVEANLYLNRTRLNMLTSRQAETTFTAMPVWLVLETTYTHALGSLRWRGFEMHSAIGALVDNPDDMQLLNHPDQNIMWYNQSESSRRSSESTTASSETTTASSMPALIEATSA